LPVGGFVFFRAGETCAGRNHSNRNGSTAQNTLVIPPAEARIEGERGTSCQ